MKRGLLLLLLSGVFSFVFAAVGKITFMQGDVNIMRAGQANPASVGFELQNKDSVQTQDGSKARMVFEDGTTISIGKNTEFNIEEYLFDEANSNVGAKFNVPTGLFTAATGRISKINPDKFKLATATSTIGIRGTEFTGNVNPLFERVFCTQGTIAVTAAGVTVEVAEGFATTVRPGEAPTEAEAFEQSELEEATSETDTGAEDEGEGDGLGGLADALEGTDEGSDNELAATDSGPTVPVDTTQKGEDEIDDEAEGDSTNNLIADITTFDAGLTHHIAVGEASYPYSAHYQGSDLMVGYDSGSARVYGSRTSEDTTYTAYIEDSDYSDTDNSYSYLAWGIVTLGGHSDLTTNIYGTNGSDNYFVVGNDTESSSMPTSGTATYSANVHGYVYNVDDNYPDYDISRNHSLGGTMSVTASFDSSSASLSGDVTFTKDGSDWVTASMSGTYTYTDSYFSASISGSGSYSSASGTAYGTFFGSNAEEIGGTLYLSYSDSYSKGVFVGSKSSSSSGSSSSSSSTTSYSGSVAASGLTDPADSTIYTTLNSLYQSGDTLTNSVSDATKDVSSAYYSSSGVTPPSASTDISTQTGSTAYDDVVANSFDSSDYSYVDWGYWLTSSGTDSFYSSDSEIASTDMSRSYFVSSTNRLTTLPTTGSASYDGAIAGGISNGSTCYDAIGNFRLTANFDAQTVTLADMDIYFNSGTTGASKGLPFVSGVSSSAVSINSDLSNNNAFQITNSVLSGTSLASDSNNVVKGDFYGSGSASTPENVAGTWRLKNTANEVGVGTFIGKQ